MYLTLGPVHHLFNTNRTDVVYNPSPARRETGSPSEVAGTFGITSLDGESSSQAYTNTVTSSEMRDASPKQRPPDSISGLERHRTKPLGKLKGPFFYQSFPGDYRYLDEVIAKLKVASHLEAPQTLEPLMATDAGSMLVTSSRLAGRATVADDESVYAVLVARPPHGPYTCLICGAKRPDRKLNRAVDHIRGHFEHRPWGCHMEHPIPGSSSAPDTAPW